MYESWVKWKCRHKNAFVPHHFSLQSATKFNIKLRNKLQHPLLHLNYCNSNSNSFVRKTNARLGEKTWVLWLNISLWKKALPWKATDLKVQIEPVLWHVKWQWFTLSNLFMELNVSRCAATWNVDMIQSTFQKHKHLGTLINICMYVYDHRFSRMACFVTLSLTWICPVTNDTFLYFWSLICT